MTQRCSLTYGYIPKPYGTERYETKIQRLHVDPAFHGVQDRGWGEEHDYQPHGDDDDHVDHLVDHGFLREQLYLVYPREHLGQLLAKRTEDNDGDGNPNQSVKHAYQLAVRRVRGQVAVTCEERLGRKEIVLFNDALNTFLIWLYVVGHMVKDHSDSERENPLPPRHG